MAYTEENNYPKALALSAMAMAIFGQSINKKDNVLTDVRGARVGGRPASGRSGHRWH